MTGSMTASGQAGASGVATSPRHRSADSPPSDAQLVSALSEGDAAAWDSLVSRYGTLVYSVGLREGLDETEAADVVEATFLALLDAADSLEVRYRPAFWLVSTARQEIERVERRRGDHEVASDHPAARHRVKFAMSCEWDRVSTLHQALAQLPAHQRRTVDRAYLRHSRPPVGVPLHRRDIATDAHDDERSRALDRLRFQMTQENDS